MKNNLRNGLVTTSLISLAGLAGCERQELPLLEGKVVGESRSHDFSVATKYSFTLEIKSEEGTEYRTFPIASGATEYDSLIGVGDQVIVDPNKIHSRRGYREDAVTMVKKAEPSN